MVGLLYYKIENSREYCGFLKEHFSNEPYYVYRLTVWGDGRQNDRKAFHRVEFECPCLAISPAQRKYEQKPMKNLLCHILLILISLLGKVQS